MPKSDFLEHILELLCNEDGITSRSMFGGYGIYKNNNIFAMIINDQLYFKVDKSNIDYFLKSNLKPFSYGKNGKTVYMSYYEAPSEIYENTGLFSELVKSSYQVSIKQKNPIK